MKMRHRWCSTRKRLDRYARRHLQSALRPLEHSPRGQPSIRRRPRREAQTVRRPRPPVTVAAKIVRNAGDLVGSKIDRHGILARLRMPDLGRFHHDALRNRLRPGERPMGALGVQERPNSSPCRFQGEVGGASPFTLPRHAIMLASFGSSAIEISARRTSRAADAIRALRQTATVRWRSSSLSTSAAKA